MAFWGIEVKPGNPYTHLSKTSKGRLHVSQATLGIGSGTNKSLVQCNVGDKYPVFLCALLLGKSESCSLDLEFEEVQDVVFSVIGPRSVHLTGYYLPSRPQLAGDDESESYGEDIAHSENGESDRCSEDDGYEDSFIDDGDTIHSDDNEDNAVSKPIKKKDRKRLRKKHQPDEPVGSVVPQQKEDVPRRSRALIVESDDDDLVMEESNMKLRGEKEQREDNIDAPDKKETIVSVGNGSLPRDQQSAKGGDLKRASPDETDNKEGPMTKKRKKEHKVEVKEGTVHKKIEIADNKHNLHSELQLQSENGPNQPETTKKKNKNKKKKKKPKMGKDNDNVDVRPLIGENRESPPDEIKGSVSSASAPQIRTLSNGLIIEELREGKADGKVACQGEKVKIIYVGKLRNGSVIESNADDSPYKFCLGAGKAIEGWDIGIEGMRTGGKRRLTIPPALAYGNQGNGENIPPDSWLVYEIELISTR